MRWNANNLIDYVKYIIKTDYQTKINYHQTFDIDDFTQACLMKILSYTKILDTKQTKQNKTYILKYKQTCNLEYVHDSKIRIPEPSNLHNNISNPILKNLNPINL